ncbi:hypothetical protein N7U66_06645 [Lacinutrix neustonica]|uniref:Uncharacterized protein n=1 Tax=Lacinutrix neustonica TaxID=2980107 RepID=A0A9E8SI12_9FLAO|nr:hypothetical protein [Lacinutrix neustonica]WAC03245.1 hypothetical protein N7U66_06645 [Lacinutrix neustonica]
MTGESVTISNIEKKIRDGFGSVSESIGPNLQKAGDKLKEGFEQASEGMKRIDSNRIKSSSQTFFDTLAEVFTFLLKIFAKFIGIILMITGAAGVIATTVAVISSNFIDHVHMGNSDFLWLSQASETPLWLVSLLLYFIICIPLLLLFYLGLKILITNLKSMGNVAKFTLLGVRVLSLIGIAIVGAKQSISYSEKAPVIQSKTLETINSQDTLVLSMRSNDQFAENFNRRFRNFNTGFNENGDRVVYSQGIRLLVKSTQDSVAKVKVIKTARGSSFDGAKKRASRISYSYELKDNTLLLNNHFTIPNNESQRDQGVEVTLYLPVGSTLYANENVYNYHSNDSNRFNDLLDQGMENHYLTVENGKLICNDCPRRL